MDLETYREKALQTCPSDIERTDQLNKCVLGLNGEFWELIEALSTALQDEEDSEKHWAQVEREASDVEWYLTVCCHAVDIKRQETYDTLNDVLKAQGLTLEQIQTQGGGMELYLLHLKNVVSASVGALSEATKKIVYHDHDIESYKEQMTRGLHLIDLALTKIYKMFDYLGRAQIRALNIEKLRNQDRDFDQLTSE